MGRLKRFYQRAEPGMTFVTRILLLSVTVTWLLILLAIVIMKWMVK